MHWMTVSIRGILSCYLTCGGSGGLQVQHIRCPGHQGQGHGAQQTAIIVITDLQLIAISIANLPANHVLEARATYASASQTGVMCNAVLHGGWAWPGGRRRTAYGQIFMIGSICQHTTTAADLMRNLCASSARSSSSSKCGTTSSTRPAARPLPLQPPQAGLQYLAALQPLHFKPASPDAAVMSATSRPTCPRPLLAPALLPAGVHALLTLSASVVARVLVLEWYAVVLLVLAGALVHVVLNWSDDQPRLVSAAAAIAPGLLLVEGDACEEPGPAAPQVADASCAGVCSGNSNTPTAADASGACRVAIRGQFAAVTQSPSLLQQLRRPALQLPQQLPSCISNSRGT
jgi:hypothetical protein